MALIDLQNIRLGFGGHPLFDGINLQLDDGERCCLVGRNGVGKTTLFKVIAGLMEADEGTISRKQGLRVSWVPQDIPDDVHGHISEVVAGGLTDRHDGRDEVARILSRMDLDGDLLYEKLSGGLKRRVFLARALVNDPDILLLDEPTNHLDIASIIWLEDFLMHSRQCLLFITHDRAFARRLATRVSEIDRGKLLHFNCAYTTYLSRREDQLAAEERQEAEFKKKLAAEEVWIRRGVKARRVRDEGRVKALKAMRREWAERREKAGTVKFGLGESNRSGTMVAMAQNISYSWPGSGQVLIKDFSTSIQRGDKVGLIGPNGSGKTTFVKILLGELMPDSGTVRLGASLQVVYFDQLREQLDHTRTVWENLAGSDDSVIVNGQSRHVLAYLQDFLFTAERSRSPVNILSGGERNRLLLAKLFLKPANLLVLDEPTNDLDAETLDLLENLLVEFKGTLLLVSHDRDFLDEVVTSSLVFSGNGEVGEYAGGYADWLIQKKAADEQAKNGTTQGADRTGQAGAANGGSAGTQTLVKTRKLSFKETKELESLPDRIAALEAEKLVFHDKMADPELYRQGPMALLEASKRLEAIEKDLSAAFARWEHLEGLAAGD